MNLPKYLYRPSDNEPYILKKDMYWWGWLGFLPQTLKSLGFRETPFSQEELKENSYTSQFMFIKSELDLCITCGKQIPYKFGGAKCEDGHITTHQYPCMGCGVVLGLVVDDDYCGPELIYCNNCMNKFKARLVII